MAQRRKTADAPGDTMADSPERINLRKMSLIVIAR
jgi:hypothetical protein